MAAAYKPNNAENRAIHASEERGVDVSMPGAMRPLRPGMLTAPRAGMHVAPPRVPRMPHVGVQRKRKYYGEI